MKLVLGSVQFGIKYGVNNQYGIPSDFELTNILKNAITNNIDTIDTAMAYGNAELRLGELGEGKFQFISKFPPVKDSKEIFEHFSCSLRKLQSESLYGYMAHNADILIENPDYWEVLQNLKAEGKIQKIGYSLYTPNQLKKLLLIGIKPDIVQIPYSLLDRKFESQFTILASINTEIHVRSVFLQGLYFKNPDTLSGKLVALRKPLIRLNELCSFYSISMAALALSFALHQDYIDKVVIGIDSVQQLNENIGNIYPYENIKPLMEEIQSICIENPELLNPANW
jgi:aryl-alcohol dehydrogenase-like predicted oxidoreductase